MFDDYLIKEVDYYLQCDSDSGLISEANLDIKFLRGNKSLISFLRHFNIKLNLEAMADFSRFLKNKKIGDVVLFNNEADYFLCKIVDAKESNLLINFRKVSDTLPRVKKFLRRTNIDPLTKLLQKDAIEYYVEKWIEKHPNSEASMFMIDIDYFKNINDNYGHIFGDKVLEIVASNLLSISNKTKIGRIGGDEFLLFVEEPLDFSGLKNIARLIRYCFDNIVIDDIEYSFSCTIGICEYPKNGKTFLDLYNNCDKALYRGKNKGRDCHIIYDPKLHDISLDQTKKVVVPQIRRMSMATFFTSILKKAILEDLDVKFDAYRMVAEYFNLDRVVMLLDGKTQQLYLGKDVPAANYDNIDLEEYQKFFEVDDMFALSDFEAWKFTNSDLFNIFTNSKTKSFIQVLIKDIDDKVVGFASLESINEKRVWQKNEINSCIILVKLANMIITQKRSLKK